MKKNLLIVLGFMMIPMAYGGEKKHAIGLRNGIVSQSNFELSYQSYLNHTTRLEFGLGVAEYPIQTTGVYQKVGDLSEIAPGLKIYAGAGLVAGFHASKTAIGGLVQGGLEFNFSFPLQVSIDYRPKVFISSESIYYDDVSLGLRFKF